MRVLHEARMRLFSRAAGLHERGKQPAIDSEWYPKWSSLTGRSLGRSVVSGRVDALMRERDLVA
jgi:hypothetical protein